MTGIVEVKIKSVEIKTAAQTVVLQIHGLHNYFLQFSIVVFFFSFHVIFAQTNSPTQTAAKAGNMFLFKLYRLF